MNRNTTAKKIAKAKKMMTASAMAVMMGAVPVMSAATVYAAPTNITKPTAGTKTTFDKYVVMDKEANVPNATFSYTVSIPTDDEMKALPNPEDTNGTNLTVRKGIGAPTASDTKFAAGDETFDAAQAVRTNSASKTYDDATADQVDGLAAGKKYAKHTSTVDFSKVNFSEPGVYRYKITENDSDEKGITTDKTPRFLDVYVESADDGTLKITGYVLHTDNIQQKKGTATGDNNTEGKNKGFTNTYDTSDITIGKTVTGNQGYRDQYFKFSVDITGLDGGARMFVTKADSDTRDYNSKETVNYAYDSSSGTRKTDDQARFVAHDGSFADINSVKSDNDNKTPDATGTTEKTGEAVLADAKGLALTADDTGHASFDVYLKHNEKVRLNGLTAGAKYTIKEESLDYNASATQDGNALTLDTKKHDATNHTDTTDELTTTAADTDVEFTNNREGILPTGYVYNNRMALALGALAAAGAAFAGIFAKKRKEKDEELKAQEDNLA